MANINSNPTAKANLSYHDFPMHQHLEFTSPPAQLLPVYYDLLDPGDKIHGDLYLKTRTQPLESSAMARLKEHVQWFFVPIHQIYKPFNGFYNGVQDLDSSLYNLLDSTGQYKISSKFPFLRNNVWYQFIWDIMTALNEKTLKGEQLYVEMVRLMEHFGISDRLNDRAPNDLTELSNLQSAFSFTPLLACAYQKIFMDWFRDGDYIANDPDCYNLDKFALAAAEGNMYNAVTESELFASLKKMFQMRYAPIRKDFWTNIYPSPLFGPNQASSQNFNHASGYDSTLVKVNQWLTNLGSVDLIDVDGDTGLSGPPMASVVDNLSDLRDLNQPNIRTMFAVDKLLEVTRRAGKHYDAQTLAHFGVSVPETIEGQCMRIGRHEQDILIGDVVSTSNTSTGDPDVGSPLGEIAGKGYSAQGSNNIDFTAPCHGVLMAIYWCEPVIDYYQQGLDKLNALIEKSDFFVPEFDNLGMQPLFRYQGYVASGNVSGYGDDESAILNTGILGWQYRYSEFKQKFNRIITGMKYTQKHWTVGKESGSAAATSASSFYHDPACLNSVMVADYLKGYDETGAVVRQSSAIYDRDPLIHEMQFAITKASKKSVYGLMQL